MSLTCSPASAASALASKELECKPLDSVKSIPIAKPSSESTGQMSLFSEISEKFQPTSWVRG